MQQKFEWPISASSPARDLRWKVTEALSPLLLRPYNWIGAMGHGMRKLRLDKELAEYDFLHRLRHGVAADLDQLVCAGTILIASCNEDFPATVLPLEDQLLVNPTSFDGLFAKVASRLYGLDRSGTN